MNSSSGLGTPGRVPQVGHNSGQGPYFNDLDVRILRNFPMHEQLTLQFLDEASNLLNHPNVLSVATTGYFFVVPGKSGGGVSCAAASGTFTAA
jgi:hypothetical protein